jgi:hypothetical protein
MNRIFLSVVLLLASFLPASAHASGPLTGYLRGADTVYIARVTTLQGGSITFAITGTIRGLPVRTLQLHTLSGGPGAGCGNSFTVKSEWLLVSCPVGFSKDTVGWAMKGDCGWIPGKIVEIGGERYVRDWTITIPQNTGETLTAGMDLSPDGKWGIRLDHVRGFLKPPMNKT